MGERAKTVEGAADSGRVVSIHAADGAPRKGASVGVRSQIGTPIGSERLASQAQMAQVFGRALGALVRGGAGAAELLGVSQQQVSRWADPQSGLAITLRDINVLAQRCPEFGAALLGALGVLWARTTPAAAVAPTEQAGERLTDRVLACLAASSSAMSTGDVAHAVGITREMAHGTLSNLLRQGRIARPRRGHYLAVRP